jgi:hypothetical protein
MYSLSDYVLRQHNNSWACGDPVYGLLAWNCMEGNLGLYETVIHGPFRMSMESDDRVVVLPESFSPETAYRKNFVGRIHFDYHIRK